MKLVFATIMLFLLTNFAYAGLFASEKLFANPADADRWLVSLGSRAEQVAAKGERVTQKLSSEIGQEATDRAMSRLLNSEFGKKALAEWSEESVEGLARASERGLLQVAERISVKYGNDIAEIVGKGIKRGAIEADDELMYRLADYTKAVRKLGVNDPLADIGEDQIELLIKNSSNGGFKVGDQEISGISRLTKGTDRYGMTHVRNKHMQGIWDGVGPNPPSTFLIEYGVSDELAVKKLIKDSIEKGIPKRIDAFANRFQYTYTPPGKSVPMITIVDNDFGGRVITSYPVGGG